MYKRLRAKGVFWFKRASVVLVFGGLAWGRPREARPTPVADRIEAVQRAIQQLPAERQQPFLSLAQWGNWGNWNNWNNWANWNNWRNWNNWGNWHNY
jgi:hypothetical protein